MLFEPFHFINGQQFRVIIVDAQFVSHIGCHFATVASKHNDIFYSLLFQLGYGLNTIVFQPVVNHNMTSILTIYRHMNDRSHMGAVAP